LEGLKGSVPKETFDDPAAREKAKKQIKELLEDRYTTGKNKWFFTPLRVSFVSMTRWTPLTLLLMTVLSDGSLRWYGL
jgi:large subunit ribosomal protein L27e